MFTDIAQANAYIKQLEDQLEEQKQLTECAKTTLSNWFDLAAKHEDELIDTVMSCARNYIHLSSVGGMPPNDQEACLRVAEGISTYIAKAMVPFIRKR